MAFKSDVMIRMNKGVLERKLNPKVAVAYIESAQRVVEGAVKSHPYTDRTSNNTRRLGWAVSGFGETQLGPLTTSGAGQTSSQGAGKTSKPDDVTVIVATSSGYGGYLEIGTRRMTHGPYPYIYPSWERERPRLKASLHGIV